jgi:hypothetical protein
VPSLAITALGKTAAATASFNTTTDTNTNNDDTKNNNTNNTTNGGDGGRRLPGGIAGTQAKPSESVVDDKNGEIENVEVLGDCVDEDGREYTKVVGSIPIAGTAPTSTWGQWLSGLAGLSAGPGSGPPTQPVFSLGVSTPAPARALARSVLRGKRESTKGAKKSRRGQGGQQQQPQLTPPTCTTQHRRFIKQGPR